MQDFVVIAGQSGAGRSQAANVLEDLGWFVIDNLPPSLIPKVSELAKLPASSIGRVALVVGTGRYQEEVLPAIAELRSDTDSRVRLLFLEARSRVLVQRYESTRRRHPFDTGGSLADAIESERVALEPVRAEADVVIDTSELNIHELRSRTLDLFGGDSPVEAMHTRVTSFGYKHGLPVDVDMVIDCRFLPNPFWVDDLRDLTGLDEPVRSYVLEQPATGAFLDRLRALLALLVPEYEREGKTYFTIAFGCTGGRHRSVCIAEEVAGQLRQLGVEPGVTHRDLER